MPVDLSFPGAVERLDTIPARCDRCGGPWRLVEEGLACYTCPRQVHLAALLTAALARGRLLGTGRA